MTVSIGITPDMMLNVIQIRITADDGIFLGFIPLDAIGAP